MARSMTARQYIINKGNMSDDRWHVGYDSILFFTLAVMMNGLLLFQYFQSPDINPDLLFIAEFQIMTALGGFMIGMMITREDLDVSFPSKKRIGETYVNGIVFSGVVIMMNVMLSNVLMGQTSITIESSLLTSGELHIPLVASVVEEAFFSFGLAIMLYKIFIVMFGKRGTGEMVAIIATSIFVAVFFAMIHMWVYRTAPEILIILAVNRFIYCALFLKYKNFSMVVIMHMFHNGMAMML